MADDYVWTRREGESGVAYEAFREYLRLGTKRSVRAVAAALAKSETLMKRWSSEHTWPARALAYDEHMVRAETDGYADQLANVREKHIRVADDLLDHLANRLNDFITENTDPTVRWTQAFQAAIKAHQGALLMKGDERHNDLMTTAKELLARLDQANQVDT